MVRQTSIDAYNQIKKDGSLTKLKLQVYHCIMRNDNFTAAELHNSFYYLQVKQISTVRARITELNQLGCIESLNVRKCRITGRQAHTWTLTDEQPRKEVYNFDKPPGNLKKCIAYIIMKMGADPDLGFFETGSHIDYLKQILNK